MIVLMAVAFAALLLWVIPEMLGVLSPNVEDTFSEWVWDLPWWAIGAVSILFVTAGLLMIWSVGHFWEGYVDRRRKEKEQ
jgi:hypothetical protein